MKIAIYITLSFITMFKSYSQTYSNKILDSEIETFLKWEITDAIEQNQYKRSKKIKLNAQLIPWQEALIGMLGSANVPNTFENQVNQIIQLENQYLKRFDSLPKFKAIFDIDDITYLKSQFENSHQKAAWKFDFSNVRMKKRPHNNFYSYTIPLFNKAHTIAILYKEFYCGSLCASGTVKIYKKENGVWKLYKSIGCWVS